MDSQQLHRHFSPLYPVGKLPCYSLCCCLRAIFPMMHWEQALGRASAVWFPIISQLCLVTPSWSVFLYEPLKLDVSKALHKPSLGWNLALAVPPPAPLTASDLCRFLPFISAQDSVSGELQGAWVAVSELPIEGSESPYLLGKETQILPFVLPPSSWPRNIQKK